MIEPLPVLLEIINGHNLSILNVSESVHILNVPFRLFFCQVNKQDSFFPILLIILCLSFRVEVLDGFQFDSKMVVLEFLG